MVKAVVLGAGGGIGQPLSLLLKTSPLIDELALYDVAPTAVGVGVDLSHISSVARTTGYNPTKKKDAEGKETKEYDITPDEAIGKALPGADIVVIPAGIPRKPGMARDDLFNINASIVRDLVGSVAKLAPKAFVLIISNPVNSTVPIAAEVLKKAGVFDPKRLFGVTTLDVVRAQTFVAEHSGAKDPSKTVIPVIGGHSGATIVPLFSMAKPAVSIEGNALDELTRRVQFGGDEVVQAKGGAGSATLSMAFAAFRFAEQVLRAMKGEVSTVTEPSFVYLPGIAGGDAIAKKTGCEYFSVPITLDASGAKQAIDVTSSANPYEQKLLEACSKELKGSISKGIEFVINAPPKL